MYFIKIDGNDYAIKPMNCPGSILVYKSDLHSYRDFPIKLGEMGLVHRRPDYINSAILDNLKAHQVDIIELGVQSFDEAVLKASKRGHKISDIYYACNLIKTYGFSLGIQLMIGLPNDSKEKSIESARLAAQIQPDIARLYPTLVLPDTELQRDRKSVV